MAICDSCKGNSILPEHYGALTLCKKCSMKILAPTWKNKIYSTNEEVHEQREKTLARAVSAGFPSDAITKLGSYFDGLIIPGLFKIFDGGNDQGLVVKDESVIIVTEDDFDPSDARKQLGLIASGRRGLSIDEDDNVDAFDAANLAKIALGAFSSGGSLGKIAMRAGAEIAGEVISKSNRPTIDDLPVLPQFDVPFGEQTVRYKDVDDFEFYIPEGEENLGFLLFTTAGGCGRFSGRPRRPAPAASCGRLSYRTPCALPRRTPSASPPGTSGSTRRARRRTARRRPRASPSRGRTRP